MTDQIKVTRKRAEDIIAAYGANSDRWPVDERRALLNLLDAEPELRARLADELRLDNLLAAVPAPVSHPALDEKIIRSYAPTRTRKRLNILGLGRAVWDEIWPAGRPAAWQAGLLGGAAAVGLMAGVIVPMFPAEGWSATPSADEMVDFVSTLEESDWE